MIYTKVTFHINPDNETNREILIAILSQEAFESFDETENSVQGYWPGEDFSPSKIHVLLEEISFKVAFEYEVIPDQNWNEVWEKNYFKPLLIGGKCLIRAPFHTDYPKAEYEIIIEPNMAFGTGNHETTSLMAEEILKIDFTGKKVLDMGCGTGILAILASMRGAENVTAIDIDRWAYEGTIENAQVNHISNIEALLGDASLLTNQKFDYIFANIQKNIITRDLPIYRHVLKTGGTILLSGFYKHDVPDVTSVTEKLDLTKVGLHEKNNWVVFVLRKINRMKELVEYFNSQFGKKFNENIPADVVGLINSLNRSERGALRDLLFNEARKFELEHDGGSVIFWLQNCFSTISQHMLRLHKVYFSPGFEIMDNLVELIAQSKKTIDLCVFTITDARLGEKIIECHRNGIAVRIITDNQKTQDYGSEIANFEKAGIIVKTDHSRYHMHNKFGIIDGRIAFTGSFNWTYTASKHNQENMLVTSNFDIVGQYKDEFDRLWNEMYNF